MNTLSFLLVLLMALMGPATAVLGGEETAEGPTLKLTRFSLGAHLSYWHVSDLNEFDFSGAGGGGIIGRLQIFDFLSLEARISGYGAGESRNVSVQGEGYFEETITLATLPLEAGAVVTLPIGETFRLYAGPGAGVYLFDGEFTSEQGPRKTTIDLDLDDNNGYYVLVGGGCQIARNAVLFAEAKYTWTETRVQNTGGWLVAGDKIDYTGLALSGGLLFTF